MAVIVPAIVQAAASVYNIASGEVKNAKAKKLERGNKRPVYNIPQPDYDNLSLAESMAGQGLSSAAKQVAIQNSDRGLTTTLDAQLKGGADPNAIGKTFGAYTDSINQLAIADDEARVNNINRVIQAQYRMSDQLDKQWMYNKLGPFQDTQARVAQLRGVAAGQINSGINGLSQAAGTYASSYFQNKQIEEMRLKREQDAQQGGGQLNNPDPNNSPPWMQSSLLANSITGTSAITQDQQWSNPDGPPPRPTGGGGGNQGGGNGGGNGNGGTDDNPWGLSQW